MSDRFPAEIHIGGPIPQELLGDLTNVAVAEGVRLGDYDGDLADKDLLSGAFQDGAIVGLYDPEACYGQFPGLEAFLVEHGIHFNGHNDAHHECDAENVFYRGGPEPVRMPATQGGESLVACRDILAVLDGPSPGDGEKLRGIRDLVAPSQAAPLEPIRLV
jgi:hypothetical protein